MPHIEIRTMRPRVLLDVDGVICDFLTPALETIKEVLNRPDLSLSDLKTWHLFDTFGCTKSQIDWCYDKWKEPGWCRTLPVYPGAQAGVRELQKVADVFICTSPMNGATWTNERERWLLSNFGIGRKNVIHTEAKQVCAGDFLIDDKTTMLDSWQECHPDGIGIRWRQVTNQAQSYAGPTTSSWADVVSIVGNYIGKENRRWTHR